MNKIKIVGGLIFLLSIILALLSNHIATKHRLHSVLLESINQQKSFTQEISKSIFYTYRNGENSSELLDKSIKEYLNNAKVNEDELSQNHKIAILWNLFYADVQKFREQQRVSTGYNSVITAKLVNRIYHNNVLLVNELEKFIQLKQAHDLKNISWYKQLEHILFLVLIGLLVYLFTQLRGVMRFIQKFSNTSKKILKNSTIQGLEPITVEQDNHALKEATQNYNYLVNKINSSIKYSILSMNQSSKALEEVEENIESFIELLSTMQEYQSDTLFKKEDAVIDSLESVMQLKNRLMDLKRDLDNLVKAVDA